VSEPPEENVVQFARQMFDLARSGRSAELTAYIDAGLPVDLSNDKGDSLLMLATYHDHPDTVRALLARGADPARINERGQTALAAAVFRRSSESVSVLLAAGADATTGSPSAVDMARLFNLPEMLELLDGE